MVRRVGNVKQSKRYLRRPPQRSTRQTLSYEIRSYFDADSVVSNAEALAGTEDNVVILDFTDTSFWSSTGHYGSAYCINNSPAEALAGDEVSIVLSFTDSHFVVDTGHYGSAYIRTF